MKFINEFYAIGENSEVYLVDANGNVLDKRVGVGSGRPRGKVFGVGVNDWKYVIGSSEGGVAPIYNNWSSMLQRGYDEKYNARYPTYEAVSVCKEWKESFTTFFNDVKRYMKKGWCLDKDLLFYGNKQYNKSACIFVPQWLNKLLLDSGNARGDLPQGVDWYKPRDKYRALCTVDGKQKHLGYFNNVNEASDSYINFKIDYIESKRSEIETVALHNELHLRFGSDFSLTDRIIENFKNQVKAFSKQGV